MKLYYSPGACSLSPHIVLHEAGLAYEPVLASPKRRQAQDGTDYYGSTRLGYFSLRARRRRHGMKDRPSSQSLAKPGVAKTSRTELQKGFGPLLKPATPGTTKNPVVRQRVLVRLKWVDGELNGADYLMGEQFTVADAYLFTVTGWAPFVGVDISELTNLLAYREGRAGPGALRRAPVGDGPHAAAVMRFG
ncbi:glutathione S-transferase GST-6.0-like [Vulpes lagopus]|uniref:glutathione S-transferase GST-6.0-like n=1 Tax=Vulpes lagopus TaxID=494514 RepID=UPI001BC90E94|nr:glutathione S-transferase GST-6.0-like [Vulpes lagopus]